MTTRAEATREHEVAMAKRKYELARDELADLIAQGMDTPEDHEWVAELATQLDLAQKMFSDWTENPLLMTP